MGIQHTIRQDGKGNLKTLRLTRASAIKAFCYECMGFNFYEVEKCSDPLCALYPFRNPKATKGTGKVSQKAVEALQIARVKR